MGNRTSIRIGADNIFEANNCLPITWLALFSSEEFVIEQVVEESEENDVAFYRTSQMLAFQRANKFVSMLRGHTPAWQFLRPIETLIRELEYCKPDDTIELDATQLYFSGYSMDEKVRQGASAFTRMIGELSGDNDHDLAILTNLVNDYSVGPISSIIDSTPEERMFLLIGTYWGDEDREALYSPEYFDKA